LVPKVAISLLNLKKDKLEGLLTPRFMKQERKKYMFKKTLIALALSTAAMTANATTIETVGQATATTPHSISAQTLTAAKTTILADINIILDIADTTTIVNTAEMTVTLTGAVFNSGVGMLAAGTAKATSATPTNAGSSVTYVLANVTGYNDKETITLDNLPIILDSLTSDVTVTVSFATTGGTPISGTSASLKVASVANEWSVTVAKLDAQIDVEDDRETFVGDLTTDTLGFTFADTDTGGGAQLGDYTVTLTGDFTNVASIAGYTINSAKTEAEATFTAGDANDLSGEGIAADAVFTIVSGTKAVALSEQDFSAAIEVEYSTDKTFALLTAAAANAGGWELNSTSTSINYAPFGPNTQLILNATSVFTEDASVDLEYKSPVTNKSVTLTDIGTVAANSVTKLGDIVSAAIVAEEGVTSGKTSLKLSVNAPEGNVTFFAGFKDKVTGSRMALEQVTTTEADAAAAKTSAAAAAADAKLAAADAALNKTALVTNSVITTDAATVAAVDAYVGVKVAGPNVNDAYTADDVTAINVLCGGLATPLTFQTAMAGGAVGAGASANGDACLCVNVVVKY
jgi:hypothetical protein